MSKTIFYTATTLDGFLADDNDSLDWLLTQPIDEDGPFNYGEFIATIGAIAMGSTTYEWVLDHNATSGDAWAYEQPCWVFTHRDLPAIPGAALHFVQGDVRPVHAAMTAAAAGKNLWVVGGGALAGDFADAGLLDELILGVAPVTLGAGAPLLPRRLPSSRLSLSSMERHGEFAYLTYAVAPPPS